MFHFPYVIYYPTEIESTNQTLPAVVVANGSGCKASKYPALFEHLASWDFIVIGTEEYDWNGFASEMCVWHLMRLNEIDTVNDKELAHNPEWDYDASKITAPVLVFGGDNDWVATKEQFKSIYNDISGDKCMALRKNTEHNQMLYSGDGYVTDWFMYWLKGDKEAAKAFFGDNAEIMNNSYWQDINKSF